MLWLQIAVLLAGCLTAPMDVRVDWENVHAWTVANRDEPEIAPFDPLFVPMAEMLSGHGTGLMRVLDDGEIVIALSLDAPVEYERGAVLGKFFRLVPEFAVETLVIPNPYWGEFDVAFDPATKAARIVADQSVTLCELTMSELSDDVISSDAGGVPKIAAIQIAACDLSEAQLADALRLDEQSIPWLRADEWPEALIDVYELWRQVDGGDDLDPDCTDCASGGPGSTSCNIAGCPNPPTDCAVYCRSGWFACCKCKQSGGSTFASCKCCIP